MSAIESKQTQVEAVLQLAPVSAALTAWRNNANSSRPSP